MSNLPKGKVHDGINGPDKKEKDLLFGEIITDNPAQPYQETIDVLKLFMKKHGIHKINVGWKVKT